MKHSGTISAHAQTLKRVIAVGICVEVHWSYSGHGTQFVDDTVRKTTECTYIADGRVHV